MNRASAIALILALVLFLTAVPAIAAGATPVSSRGVELSLYYTDVRVQLLQFKQLAFRGRCLKDRV